MFRSFPCRFFILIIVTNEKKYLGKDGGNPSEVHPVEEVPGARRRGAAPAGRSGAPAPAQLGRKVRRVSGSVTNVCVCVL